MNLSSLVLKIAKHMAWLQQITYAATQHGHPRQSYHLFEILGVIDLPKSVYYYHMHHEDSKKRDQELIDEIIKIHKEHPAYGYRQVTLELHNRGWKINHRRVQRIMQEHCLQSIAYTKKKRKYNSYKGSVSKIAPNRLHRRFYTDRPYQNRRRYRTTLGR